MSEQDTIPVNTIDIAATRRRSRFREPQTDVLSENVNPFLDQMEDILDKTSKEVGKGKFRFTEFTVSAEISTKVALVLMGASVEAEVSRGLTFKFERK